MCKIIFLYGKDFLVMPVFNLAIALFLPYLTKSRCSLRELGLPQSPLNVALKDAVDWFVSNGYAK
ncbi:hypothetical protein [Anabaena lutea]|uniref:hypothetical protein n=1 Tax=Anabaena lutea TaxID=212350 RepID=UPI001688EC50|nr:hypothetical protein [Anabaena lutea]